MEENTKKKIEDLLASQKTFLFMKGTPSFPQCGFSARAVAILKELEIEFGSFDVLEDEEIRQGIKDFGNWPTIPQLYHNNELLGGSDILLEMYQAGELQDTLKTNMRNLRFLDRLIRIVIGTFMVAWAFAGGPLWTYLGLILLATGSWGFCPGYWALKINKS